MAKSRYCPNCGEDYTNEDFGHSYDAIGEFGKCTTCLGYCPYCPIDQQIAEKVLYVIEELNGIRLDAEWDKYVEALRQPISEILKKAYPDIRLKIDINTN